MLRIDQRRRWRHWQAANIKLLLSPLTPERKQELVEATTEYVRDKDDNIVDIKRDVATYARLVGEECIHGWEGVVVEVAEDQLEALEFDKRRIGEFMAIGPAQAFVFGEVEGLGIHIVAETQAAGNA